MKWTKKIIIILLFLTITTLNPVTTDRSCNNQFRTGPTVKWQDGTIQIRGNWFRLDQKTRDSIIDSVYKDNYPYLE